MANEKDKQILVQVIPVEASGEISWGTSVTDELERRLDDIRNAVAAGAKTVAGSLPHLPSAENWNLAEVEASFAITLTAEAGVILSKASAGATFEIKVLYKREP
jgi:Trypsin-co-occurring domain 1